MFLGYLVALKRIFETTGYLRRLDEQELSILGSKLIDISQRAVNVVLDVLMSTCPKKG